MTPPNATPTRADVLRDRIAWVKGLAIVSDHGVRLNAGSYVTCHEYRAQAEALIDAMADEVLRLRAHRDAMIRRVEGLERYGADMRIRDDGALLSRVAVLAVLREGGDA